MSANRHHPPKKFLPRAPMAYDVNMEARVAVLEQIAKDNRETFRDIRDVLQRLDAKIDGVDAKLNDKMDAGFSKLNDKIDTGLTKLNDKMDAGFSKLDTKIDSKIDGIRDRQERDFRLLFGALITAALGLAALMAHGFGWF